MGIGKMITKIIPMKRTFLFIAATLFMQNLEAQEQDKDSIGFHHKISLGVGAFAGLSHLFGQPKEAHSFAGGNFGCMTQVGYKLTRHLNVSSGFRWSKSDQTIKLSVGINPDFFVMSTTTAQVPLLVSYIFHSKQHKQLFGINLGASYNWNTYHTTYEQLVYTWPSTVPSQEINKKTTANDYSIMFSIFKNFNLNKKGNIQMQVFNEYQLNLYTSRFRNRVVDPIYLIATNQDRFTPFFIRCGIYINFNL